MRQATVRVKDRSGSSEVETMLCNKPSKTRKKALRDALEELQGNDVYIEKGIKDFPLLNHAS